MSPLSSVCNCYTFLLCENKRHANREKCGETYLICSLFTITCCGGFLLDQHSGWSTYADWKIEADTWKKKKKDTPTKCILPFCSEWIINIQTLKWEFICVLHTKELHRAKRLWIKCNTIQKHHKLQPQKWSYSWIDTSLRQFQQNPNIKIAVKGAFIGALLKYVYIKLYKPATKYKHGYRNLTHLEHCFLLSWMTLWWLCVISSTLLVFPFFAPRKTHPIMMAIHSNVVTLQVLSAITLLSLKDFPSLTWLNQSYPTVLSKLSRANTDMQQITDMYWQTQPTTCRIDLNTNEAQTNRRDLQKNVHFSVYTEIQLSFSHPWKRLTLVIKTVKAKKTTT